MHVRYTLLSALLPLVSAAAATGTVTAIHSFSGSDGAFPVGGLIASSAGRLFGTTSGGGNGFGTVFELTFQPQSATWSQTMLHAFSGPDGANPSARLTGVNGSLYGTAGNGGSEGFGTVFQLTPSGTGAPWTETPLYTFQGATDGRGPFGNLVADKAGNLYGTTTYGGTTACTTGQGCGTVFQLSPPPVPGGAWTETILYRFQFGTDGVNPLAGLVLGKDGSLYGTTPAGGTSGNGTVFRVTPPLRAGGAWTETVIYNFTGRTDGIQPDGGLALGTGGTLYGSTSGGGSFGCGTVFVLAPPSAPETAWLKTTLHEFNCSDGAYPQAALLLKPGVVYGTTSGGGQNGAGTVFALVAIGPGRPWAEFTLCDFQSSSSGANSSSTLFIGPGGKLFGTAMNGGSGNLGTVFDLIP